MIAKGLYRKPGVYIFVEPTVGVDIGARATLYRIIRELSREAAVIVLSSDSDEVQGLADRGLTPDKRRPVGAPRHDASRDERLSAGIMRAVAA